MFLLKAKAIAIAEISYYHLVKNWQISDSGVNNEHGHATGSGAALRPSAPVIKRLVIR